MKSSVEFVDGSRAQVWVHAPERFGTALQYATGKGCLISIAADAHRTGGLEDLRYGVAVARKGWVRPEQVLNNKGLPDLRAWLSNRI